MAWGSGDKWIVSASADRTIKVWPVPEIMRSGPARQVQLGCEQLWRTGAPLAFSAEDAATWPVLQGEPVDGATGNLVSPCVGALPAAAFQRAKAPQ